MLWGGRFSKGPDKGILEFNSAENILLDEKLVPYDIIGSLAHVRMLRKQRILKKAEASAIIKALGFIMKDWEKGRFKLDPELEDVHMNIETAVSEKTEHGKRMHTARSRNDQVLLDMRMYMRDQIILLALAMQEMRKAFANLSKKDGIMVGYTHTRVAQPITISLWCDAQVQALGRDLERLRGCYQRVNQNPLGACALSGTPWEIDRKHTAKLLAFDSVQENELDAISSRGEAEAELLSALGMTMARLSGLAEELIWLSQKGLVGLPEEFCTGSSIMPNKKNPDALELIRGRASRVHSNLFHILSVKKGLISGYHSDMQETKYALMSGIEASLASITVMAKLIGKLRFDQGAIKQELEQGYAQATEIADRLAMKGMPFRDAHAEAGRLVRECEARGITLSQHEGVGKGMASLERERLKRKIVLEDDGFFKKERKRIDKAFHDMMAPSSA